LRVDVETSLDQLDLTDRRRLFAQPRLNLGTSPLEVGATPCRHLRRPERGQVGSDRVGLRSPLATFRRALRLKDQPVRVRVDRHLHTEGNSVTLAVTVVCQDGVVVATDSRTTRPHAACWRRERGG
jgi:hypothetical protein